MQVKVRDGTLTRLFSITLAFILISGAITVAIPSALPSAYAAGNKPDKVENLILVFSSTQVTLIWDEPASNNGGPITGYHIEIQYSCDDIILPQYSCGGYDDVVTNTGNTLTYYLVTSLVPSQVYNFKVSAINAAGEGTSSNQKFGTTLEFPSVTLSSTAPDPTSTSPIPVTATFSESVTGFEVSEIVTNGATSNFFAVSGAIYTFDVTPAGQGLVTVDIPANVAFDIVGGGNTAAITLSRIFDTEFPDTSITSTPSNPSSSSSASFSFTSTEAGTFECQLDSGGFSACTTPKLYSSLSAGSHTFDVRAIDLVGNVDPTPASFTWTIDTTAPSVVLSTTAADPTNLSPFTVTATFSESVSGFEESDITVLNGVASALAGGPSVYTFSVTPSGQGLVSINVAADKATDAAGNGNTAAATLSRTFDSVKPTIILSTTAANPTNVSPFTVTATFSEDVTGFALGDISMTNGVASVLSGGPSVYTFNVTPSSNDLVTVDVEADAATDAAGNGNTAAATLSRTFDNISPTVTLTSGSPNPTNAPFTVTATFSESVSDFVSSDVTTVNGVLSGFSGSGTTYTFTITPSSNGLVTVDVAASVATDAAGNGNTAASTLSRTYDSVKPALVLSTAVSDPTNVSPFTVTATFSKPVTGFAIGDISMTNGVASVLAGGPSVYTFSVTPSGQGLVSINVAADVATDSVGNGNTAAATLSRTFDSVKPTIVLSTTAANPTNVSPFTVTATFSESVSGFALGDIIVTNGVASSLAGGSSIYTFSVTPSGQGLVSINVAADKATDAAGNGNTAAATLNRTYDSVQPTLVLSTTVTDPTNVSPFTVTATFSESVSGFAIGDISMTNGVASSLAGGPSVYTFSVTPSGQGLVSINVAAGVATDAAGNGNTAAATLSRTYDSVQPTIVLSTTAADPTNLSPFTVTATFSKPVTGFTLGDIVVTNGVASSLAGGPSVYTFSVTPTSDGLVSVNVGANVATDSVGNGNTAAATLSRTYDGTAPTLVLSTTVTDPTNVSPFTVTATFSESVSGFTIGDITVTNGVATAFAGGPSIYTFSVTPSSNDLVTVDVEADAATDAAGNGSTADSISRTYDSVKPTLVLSTTAADPTNLSPLTVTATFSKSVSGFALGDIIVTNGAASALTGGSSVYTFSVTPTSDGLVSINVAADVATDSVGNGNTAAATLSRTYDGTAPTLVLSTAIVDPTNVSPFTVTATFSEDVTDFELDDITVTNGAASSLAGGPSIYTFSVTPSSNGLVTVDVGAGVATDAAGNGNTADSISRTYDSEKPTVTLSTEVSDPTNVSPFTVTATFSEDVTDFALGDIIITNGAASSLDGGPSVYTFDVTPFSNGLVLIDVVADAALDEVGNGNTPAATLSITSDAFSLSGFAASQTIINLQWTAAADSDSECSLEGYDIFRDGVDIGDVTDLNDRTFSDTDLLGNTEYTYQVKGVYSCEDITAESNEITIQTLPFQNGALSWDITPPSVDGISFSSVQDGTPTEGFGGRLASYSNDIPTQIMDTGVEQRFQVGIYDNNGIAAIKRVVVNMYFDYLETQKADTYFMYIEGEGLTVSDPLGFFGDVKVHRTYTESEMILTFVFTPQKPMPITDVVINGEDEYRNSMNTIIFGAFEIQGEPITSVEESTTSSMVPYYKNPEWNQFVIDSDGNMITYDAFGNLETKPTHVIDESVYYGKYIGKSERHDDGFYDKVMAEEVKAQELVDARDSHKIFSEPQKVFKVYKAFKYPSTVGKADRGDVKSMNDLKQKEHSKAMHVAKKLSQ